MLHYDKRALKRLLAERGLKQNHVASKAGLSYRTLYYIALGVSVPKADTLAKIASVLEIGVERFFVRKEKAA